LRGKGSAARRACGGMSSGCGWRRSSSASCGGCCSSGCASGCASGCCSCGGACHTCAHSHGCCGGCGCGCSSCCCCCGPGGGACHACARSCGSGCCCGCWNGCWRMNSGTYHGACHGRARGRGGVCGAPARYCRVWGPPGVGRPRGRACGCDCRRGRGRRRQYRAASRSSGWNADARDPCRQRGGGARTGGLPAAMPRGGGGAPPWLVRSRDRAGLQPPHLADRSSSAILSAGRRSSKGCAVRATPRPGVAACCAVLDQPCMRGQSRGVWRLIGPARPWTPGLACIDASVDGGPSCCVLHARVACPQGFVPDILCWSPCPPGRWRPTIHAAYASAGACDRLAAGSPGRSRSMTPRAAVCSDLTRGARISWQWCVNYLRPAS